MDGNLMLIERLEREAMIWGGETAGGLRKAIDIIRLHLAEQPSLIHSLRTVAETGFLPDGDGINLPTQMWLEELLKQYQAEQPVNVVGHVKDMINAHNMSHEPYCDSSSWRDDFKVCAEKAITALGSVSSQELKVSGMTARNDPANMGEDLATESPEGDAGQLGRNSGQPSPATNTLTHLPEPLVSKQPEPESTGEDHGRMAVGGLNQASGYSDVTEANFGNIAETGGGSDIQREMRYPALLQQMSDLIYNKAHILNAGNSQTAIGNADEISSAIMDLLKPYFRLPEPVMVSLRKCWLAANQTMGPCLGMTTEEWVRITKAVLDAAGVKYVE
jgi:hypothetical protein